MATEKDEVDLKIDRILDRYVRHKKETLAPECPAAEELLDYIDGKLDEAHALAMAEHVPFCDDCHEIVLSFKLPFEPASFAAAGAGPLPWEEAQDKLLDSLGPVPGRRAASRGRWQTWVGWDRYLVVYRRPLRLAVAAMLIVLLLASVVWWKGQPTELSRLAYVTPPSGMIELRSSEDMTEDPYNAQYRQGEEALLKSQLGMFNRVDTPKVDEAIGHLQTALKLAEAQNNQTYMAESYFYLGKAYLKKNDLAQARKQFTELMKLEGSSNLLLKRQREAKEIIDTIDGFDRK